MIRKLMQLLRSLSRFAARLLTPPAIVLLHIVMLPVDLLFLVFDAFWVNFRKTRILGADCRGRDSYNPVCPPARKYTNKALFRLICPEMRRSGVERRTVCRAGERPVLRIVRAFFLIAVLGCAGLAGLIALHRTWSPTPGEAEPAERVTQARIALGDEEFGNGRYREALGYYMRALRLAPQDRELIYKAGLCYAELREEDNATRYFALAARGDDAHPPHPPAVRQMAVRMYERGAVGPAGAYAQRANDMGIADGPILAILADSLLWQQKPDEAQPHLEAAIAANPDSSIVKVAQAHALAVGGDADGALAILEGVADDRSVGLLAGLYKLDVLRQAGRPEEALTEARALADRFPELGWLSVRALDTRFASGDRAEALAEAERLRSQLGKDPAAKLDLAVSVARHGYDALAMEIAEECAKDPQVGPRANVFMGGLYLQRGMLEHARVYADRALAVQPAYVAALLLGARAALSARDADATGRYLSAAVEAAPEDPAVWQSLGELHAALGDGQAAEEAFRKAVELAPENGLVHQSLGMVLQARSKNEDARTELLEAARLLPNPMSAYTSLGMLAKASGNGAEAREHYLKAIEAAPGEAAIAANNLADLILADPAATEDDRLVALALAYSAYGKVRGTRFEPTVAATLRQALEANGLRADQLGVALTEPTAEQDPSQPRTATAGARAETPGTSSGG
jgi:tetratricopeptide (TPR) repeat protein